MELEKLSLLGNFHNIQVLETKCGDLIVMRQPSCSDDVKVEDFLPCPHCYGFVRKIDLWQHNKSCQFKESCGDGEGEDEQKYTRLQQHSKLILLTHHKHSECRALLKTFAAMKSDEITITARNDELIKMYAASLTEKFGGQRLHDVSQGMRQLARLLLDMTCPRVCVN